VAGSHIYLDNGEYKVTVTVADDDGAAVSDSILVTVNNVAPVVEAGEDQTVIALDTLSLALSTFTDPSVVDTHSATIDWGDGSPPEDGTVTQGAGSGSVDDSHVFTLPGIYVVTVTVTDDDGGVGSDTLEVTVLGPVDLKEGVIEDLPPHVGESKRFTKAMKEIEKSLDTKLWIDEIHLEKKHGKKVFDHERHAVKELVHLLKGIPDGAKCEGISFIELEYTGPGTIDVDVYLKNLFLGRFTVSTAEAFVVEATDETNDELHSEIRLVIDGNEAARIHTSCSKPIDIGDVHGNFVITDLVKLLKGEGDADEKCEGISRIELKYTGAVPVNVEVALKKTVLGTFSLSEGNRLFVVEATDETGGKLHPEIRLVIDGAEAAEIHTSCSKPIVEGDIHGDFEIIYLEKLFKEGKSKKDQVSNEALAAAQTAIDELVKSDRILAQTLLNELDGAVAVDPSRQDKVDKELDKVRAELAKGDVDRDAGKPDKAIQHYRKAWEHAWHALKEESYHK
jgi:PKD repeat protein